MERLCAASLSFPYMRPTTVRCATLHDQKINFNHANVYDKSSNFNHAKFSLPLPKKFPPTISEGHRLSSLSRGEKIICQSTVRPGWLDTTIPEPLRPYFMLARVNRDIGWWLQVWPSYWSIALATKPGVLPDVRLMILLGGISLLMHTSCCTLNDLHDIEFDKQVARSKKRPLASGELKPLQGWSFWGFQLLLMTPLLLALNKLCIGLAAAQHLLWFLYPLMKRVTYLPQAFLGVAINWSALVGWAAVRGNFADLGTILPIFIGSAFWTLAYDTIYAHQDREDDIKAGVKSTAVLFGDKTVYWNLGFTAISIGCFLLGGYNGGLGWPFYASMIAAAGHLLWQVLTADLSNPSDCHNKFFSNKGFGMIVFTGILLGRLAP
ncbi:4-hydroxybenzoate polyprenyltransferase [Carex littledalei]|uniref:4-hydroxybenzoate polyprenyltransferase, mitochondrial n=1 Tax=Carex littledalei TaxID=544730 RepID=A0A833VT58_9POAL|nr:4-hydroxybenzoate polyprenyltransferase [Carex littledalei]